MSNMSEIFPGGLSDEEQKQIWDYVRGAWRGAANSMLDDYVKPNPDQLVVMVKCFLLGMIEMSRVDPTERTMKVATTLLARTFGGLDNLDQIVESEGQVKTEDLPNNSAPFTVSPGEWSY